MNKSRRLWYLVLSLAFAGLIGFIALGWDRPGHPVVAATSDQSASVGGAPNTVPVLASGTVPVVAIPATAPGTASGSVRPVQVRPGTFPVYDVRLPDGPLAPDEATAQRELAQTPHATGMLHMVPDIGVMGNGNAFLSLSPDVAPPGAVNSVAMVASGFRPFEIIVISSFMTPVGYLQANSDGVVLARLTPGGSAGVVLVRVQGLYSGIAAAGTFRISNAAPSVPGLAIAPHALRIGDTLYMLGVRYTASISVTITRNGTTVTSVRTRSDGSTDTVPLVIGGSAGDAGAVYAAYEQSNRVGSMAGQSIEERADAGVGGDNNLSRAFIDRPILSSTLTTTLGLVGEGFVTGETVNLTRQPGTPLGSATADSNGAVSFFVQSPPGANVYGLLLAGQSSGRHGYAAIQADSRAYNEPSTLVAPSRTNSTNGSVNVLFTRYPPNVQLALQVDGGVQGAVSSGAGGYGSVPVVKPTVGPIVHDYALSETFGLHISSAPLALAHTGAVTGVVHDALSGQPVKALIRISGDSSAVVMSDPTAAGVYTITYQAGSATVNVSPSGCYMPQSQAVVIQPDGVEVVNIDLQRSVNDGGGYTCYENAGRSFTAAPNQVFGNTFNEGAASFSLPFPVRFYGSNVTTGTISTNGFITLGNQFTCTTSCYPNNVTIPTGNLPNGFVAANWDDLAGLATDPSSGVYSGVVGTAPNRTFIVEWRDVRNFTDSTSAVNTFEIQIPEGISGNSSDIYTVYNTFNPGLSDGSQGTIGTEDQAGHFGKQMEGNTVLPGQLGNTGEVSNYIWPGESVRFWQSVVPTFTPTPTNTGTPTQTRTPTPVTPSNTPTPETCRSDGNYVQTYGGGASIVPGDTDVGNHGDNVDTAISLPFTYMFYGQPFSTADVSSNGALQFSGTTTTANNVCLGNGAVHDAILPYWDDLRTDGSGGVGIFTSTSGAAPDRIFNIEWRACIYAASGCSSIDTNFEIRLYEGQQKMDLIYGTLLQNGNGATIGVQKQAGAQYRQYSCNAPTLSSGFRVTYAQIPCSTATVTRTPTITPTPSNTRTITPIATIPQGSPTPVSVCGQVRTHFFASSPDGAHEVPSNNSPGQGTASFAIDTTSNVMTYTLSFHDLVTQETGAVLGLGAPGSAGTTIATLAVGNPASGSIPFPAADLAALYAGDVYVNIESSAFPGGEIRDQLHEQCLSTPVPTSSPGTPGPTNTAGPTPPPGSTNTPTSPPGSTDTPTPRPTHTQGPTNTPRPTVPPGTTATPCPVSFSDVHPTDFFYQSVVYLYCNGIINGYNDHTFRPYNNTTRAQFSKMIVLALGWTIVDPATPSYVDVPANNAFYDVIETAKAHNLITGYGCGGPGEPCPGRYFRPNVSITRAQISKLIALALGWQPQAPVTQIFHDVPPGDGFYDVIEAVYQHGVITGYGCGSVGEPCDPQNHRYFRPALNATRGQLSKMLFVALTNP